MSEGDRIVPLRRSRKAGPRCPICGQPTVSSFRPFCSRRCADVDLGRWLTGSYRVETDEQPEEGGLPGDSEA